MGVETPGNPKTWRLGLEMSHLLAIPRPTSGTYKKQAAGQLSPLPGKAFPGRGSAACANKGPSEVTSKAGPRDGWFLLCWLEDHGDRSGAAGEVN